MPGTWYYMEACLKVNWIFKHAPGHVSAEIQEAQGMVTCSVHAAFWGFERRSCCGMLDLSGIQDIE